MNHKTTKIVFAVILILLVNLACRALSLNSGPSLVGTWESEYQGSSVIMTFNDDGSMVGYFNEEAQAGTYDVNYSASPHQLDLVFDAQDAPIFTIFEFIDEDTIRMENSNPGSSRPASFSDSIVMQRAK